MKKKWIVYILLTLCVFTINSCSSDDQTDKESLFKNLVDNLGGEVNITDLKTISYNCNGMSYDPEQHGVGFSAPHITAEYAYNFSSMLNERKVKMYYDNFDILYPFSRSPKNALFTIDDKHGTVSGEYGFRAYYLGQVQPSALYSPRIEAILKVQKLCNPLEIIQEVIKNKTFEDGPENTFSIPTKVNGLNIDLVIDANTNLPLKAVTKEFNFLAGDVSLEAVYEDWSEIEGYKLPTKVKFLLNGILVREENISDIKINPILAEDHFKLEEAQLISYNETESVKGIISSEWYMRTFYQGIAMDQPLGVAFNMEDIDLSSLNVGSQYISENVKLVGRPDANIWPVGINTEEGIYLIELASTPAWSKAGLELLKYEFQNDNVAGAIATHTHNTHIEGIKGVMEDVDRIYVGKGSKGVIEDAINSNSTLTEYKAKPSIEVIEINDVLKIANGEIELHIFEMDETESNPHAEDLIIAYLPKEKVLIQTDIVYSALFNNIFHNFTYQTFSDETKLSLKKRAKYLLDYIENKNLDVEKIVCTHGGVANLQQVNAVASY